MTSDSAMYLPQKPRYEILDGLRGVAALLILTYHIFEVESSNAASQIINHGYMAVDFFYLLSGFVIGYAYDDRWDRMTLKDFFKRRLTRLHPMVIMGTFIGIVLFLFGENGLRVASEGHTWQMVICFLLAIIMIPVLPSMDFRGWRGMYPYNGPSWSLFYEYIANIMYSLFIRKLPKWALCICVAFFSILTLDRVLGFGLFGIVYNVGSLAGGWSIDRAHLYTGFCRLLYPFFCGLLIQRLGKYIKLNNGFYWCSLVVMLMLCLPRFGPNPIYNGIYEAICVLLFMPLVIMTGAGSVVSGKTQIICKFIGDLSFPLYITHFPIINLYNQWFINHKDSPIIQHTLVGVMVFIISISLAYICYKYYDIPIRKWLKEHWLSKL